MNKRIYLVLGILVIASIGLFIFWDRPDDPENATSVDDVVSEPVVEISPELRIKSYGFDEVYEMNESEKLTFVEENLLKIDFTEGIYRFSYNYDSEANESSIVYKDRTIYVNFNKALMTVDGQEVANTLLVKRAGNVYMDLNVFQNLFPLDVEIIEEPYFIALIDFDSENNQKNDIEETISQTLELLPEKINMTWEAVYSGGTNVSKLYEMPGLDIISPVWYDLEDGSGRLSSKMQEDYIEWADGMGYTLWPAVTNAFDPDMTHELIKSNENRRVFIDKLVNIYVENGYPGINIDFENIYKADKDLLSHFIAELTAAFHRENIIVSMDVTFSGGSENWSQCYDRTTLGEWVDFIVIMSYDEHWGSSPVSGSVASLNWVERNMALLLNEVASEKVIMGIPFYMRVWFERPSSEEVNKMRVTSDAITMHGMENILKNGDYSKIWDEPSGQYYISYIDAEDNALKKIWIEDTTSLELKVALVHKYDLKGIASWRRGYETEDVWPTINEVLRK